MKQSGYVEKVKSIARSIDNDLMTMATARSSIVTKLGQLGGMLDRLDDVINDRIDVRSQALKEKLDDLDSALSNIDDTRNDICSAKDDLEGHHTEAEIASQAIRKLLK